MGRRCGHCGHAHEPHVTTCPATGARIQHYSEVGEDDVLVGSVVADRYHVAGILGHGSTGTVFGVEHIHFGRRAAMKVLRPRYASAESAQRVFHGDARAAWSVNHPCLCEVFDIGTLPDGAPFFAMEYLEGETLARRLLRERLSLAAAVDVMMQLLSAIEAIHGRALLLRELRPENVYLSHRRGCRPLVKLLDFGLARLTPLDKVQEDWESVASGVLTHPFYLSPERTRSEHGIEPASDLFVAGVVFYEMLTGVRPFVSTSYGGLLLEIARARPMPVAELRPDVPEALDAFVMRAVSGNPRNRPASAREMQDELRRIFDSARRGGGSTSVNATAPPSATGPGVPSIGPPAETPRDRTLANPPARAPSQSVQDMFADETETDRKAIDVAALEPEADEPTEARHGSLEPHLREIRAREGGPREDQTATLQVTPEVRARLEATYPTKANAPPTGTPISEPEEPAPPTRRLDKRKK